MARKMTEWPSKRGPIAKIMLGWLQRGWGSVGDGPVVQFPQIWISSQECRMMLVMLDAIWEMSGTTEFPSSRIIDDSLLGEQCRFS